MSERFKPVAGVYLVFKKQNGEILLLRRYNTGFGDGQYSMVSGHIDGGESFQQAAIREGREEAGVAIKMNGLKVLYVLHRMNKAQNYEAINVFIQVKNWNGEIQNTEPEKCDDLSWFDPNNLPENVLDYVKFALNEIQKGQTYGEFGWGI